MSYVAIAYLAVAALVAAYVYTLAARRRMIADLAEATAHSPPPRGPLER